jgi:hypothetical protein
MTFAGRGVLGVTGDTSIADSRFVVSKISLRNSSGWGSFPRVIVFISPTASPSILIRAF